MDLSAFHLKRSRHDVRHFYEWLGYTWGEHIDEWMELYGDRKGAEVHRTCIIAPRDHSKSTTLRVKLLHKALFERWRNKPMTIWLFSASREMAANRLNEIREDLKQHPDLRNQLDEKGSNKWMVKLTNGAWIKATGIGAAIRGEHPGCVACDDVLADLGDMSMDVVRDWFRKVVTPMLSPGTSLYVVGTPMSMTDLYHTEMLTEHAKQVWKSGVWSAFPNWDEHRADPENVPLLPLWPEHRSTAFLLEQKVSINDDLAFAQEYLCKVVDDDAQVFNRHLIRENVDVESVARFNGHLDDGSRFIIGFDPAHGIGKDFSVALVLRQDDDGFVHFHDMWRRNDFPPDRQADVLIELAKKYKAPIAAEDVGFQRLYSTIIAQKGATVDFRPSKASNKGLKQGLLNRLRTWFEQKKFHWPYGNIESRNMVNIIFDELEAHAWKDGDIVDVGKHNDCVMALAHAIDQFSITKATALPMASGRTTMGDWGKGNKSTSQKGGRGMIRANYSSRYPRFNP